MVRNPVSLLFPDLRNITSNDTDNLVGEIYGKQVIYICKSDNHYNSTFIIIANNG